MTGVAAFDSSGIVGTGGCCNSPPVVVVEAAVVDSSAGASLVVAFGVDWCCVEAVESDADASPPEEVGDSGALDVKSDAVCAALSVNGRTAVPPRAPDCCSCVKYVSFESETGSHVGFRCGGIGSFFTRDGYS